MMMGINTVYFLFLVWQICGLRTTSDDPVHMSMMPEYECVSGSRPVDFFYGKDTTIAHQLYLLVDSLDRPLLYYANIQTPVCIDSICKPMYVEIYWNLIGNYVGFDIMDDHPMTKYDHDLFEKEDYQKLHRLLLDKHSILERRSLTALFDPSLKQEKQIEYKGQKVDAISGATRTEIKGSVVPGALFSCYTLWHLVNGEVTKKIVANLERINIQSLENYFLETDYPDYHYFAIRKMNPTEMAIRIDRILNIYPDASSLVRTYILKKLPESVWTDRSSASSLFQQFSKSDINSGTCMISNLYRSHDDAYKILAQQIESMTKNQLKMYLSALDGNRDRLTNDMLSDLHRVAHSRKYAHSYVIARFLQDLDERE